MAEATVAEIPVAEIPVTRPTLQQQLKRFSEAALPSNALRWYPRYHESTGEGIRIALLDSGLDCMHPCFAEARIQSKNFVNSSTLHDLTGHGTQMCALLVGKGGLVPDADLLFGRVLGSGLSARTASCLAKGIRWATHQRVDIVVLPLGRSRSSSAVHSAITAAVSSGISIFAAAGNSGADRVLFPANLSAVISVTGAGIQGQRLFDCTAFEQADRVMLGQIYSLLSKTDDSADMLTGSSPATVIAAAMAALDLSLERLKLVGRPNQIEDIATVLT